MNSNKTVRSALAALAWLLALPALAQTVYYTVDDPGHDIYENAFFQKSLASLKGGDKVELLENKLFVAKVRAGSTEGWIASKFISKVEPAVVPVVAPLAAAPATPIATPAALPGNRGRAVVFGISVYEPGHDISTLKGVPHDMNSAVAMAQLMGIPKDRVSIYRDAEVTVDSMKAILTQLAKEVNEGDPVLVYYSGHGGRAPLPGSTTSCYEGLITHNGQLITSTDMQQLLQPLAKITDGLFVFFDACHTGGLTATRALNNGDRLMPKSAPLGDVSNCLEVTNMLKRAVGSRYIYAAAARANEVSLDSPANGGLATSNFLRCMASDDRKVKTVDEIRACAQAGIDSYLSTVTGYTSHHVTITGDLNIRPVVADLSPAAKQQILAGALQGTLAGSQGYIVASAKSASVITALVAQGWPQVANPQQAFAAIAARANAALPLQVEAPDTLKIDVESLYLKVRAPADGYLYVFQSSADGTAAMLFPNRIDHNHRVRAGESVEMPRADWRLVAGGPPGNDQLLLVFSPTARDVRQLLGKPAGPFMDLDVSPAGMQALTLAMSRSAYADEAACQPGSASPPADCAAGFSASVKTIREVR